MAHKGGKYWDITHSDPLSFSPSYIRNDSFLARTCLSIKVELQDERSQATKTKVGHISFIYSVLGPSQIPFHHDPSLGNLRTLFIFSCYEKLRLETVE